jgi:hypothetical protein
MAKLCTTKPVFSSIMISLASTSAIFSLSNYGWPMGMRSSTAACATARTNLGSRAMATRMVLRSRKVMNAVSLGWQHGRQTTVQLSQPQLPQPHPLHYPHPDEQHQQPRQH